MGMKESPVSPAAKVDGTGPSLLPNRMKPQLYKVLCLILFAAIPAVGMAGLRAAYPQPVAGVAARAENVTLEHVVAWPEV